MIKMQYEKICDKILECDDKIRYVGIYDYGELYDKMRPGLTSYLTREETETSLSQAIYRWATRKKTTEKIGKPVFALAKYEKIFRMTIPITGAGLVIISTELDVDINEIADKVTKVCNTYSEME